MSTTRRTIRRTPQQESSPNMVMRIITILIVALVAIYGLATAIIIGLWLALGETNIVVNYFVNTMPLCLFPAPILLILVLLVRKWKFSIMLLAALAMFLMLYGTIFRPSGSPPLPRGTPVVLMSYNILFSNDDMATVERIIREHNVDVVALQEVTQSQREYLEANLSDILPHGTRSQRRGTHGQMILSKWPIGPIASGLQLARATVDVNGSELIVYSVQLTSPLDTTANFDDSARIEDANRIRTMAQGETEPLIILGDFNMSDATEEYTRFTTQFVDVFRYTSSGFGSTFPNLGANNPSLKFIPPLIRLDYVFTTPDIQPMAAQVVRDGTSDHFPLVVTIRFE